MRLPYLNETLRSSILPRSRPGWIGLHRIGHGGAAIQDFKDAVGRGGSPLRGRKKAAHRFQPHIQPAHICSESDKNADADFRPVEHAPGSVAPDHQHAAIGEKCDCRAKKRPEYVHTNIGIEHVLIATAEAVDLALLLGKCLHDADARNGVGQYIDHFRPSGPRTSETMTKSNSHFLRHPGNQRKWQQRNQCHRRVDIKENSRGHHDHQYVGAKIEQTHREKSANAIGIAADARNQIAGALAAEEFERQPLQVRVCIVAQASADLLTDAGEDIGLGPTQQPGEQSRAKQCGQIPGDHAEVDRQAVLARNQNVVQQRYRDIGRHQSGRRTCEREPESQRRSSRRVAAQNDLAATTNAQAAAQRTESTIRKPFAAAPSSRHTTDKSLPPAAPSASSFASRLPAVESSWNARTNDNALG